MAFARVNGVLLHYRLTGSAGAPVLGLVSSVGTDLRIWDEVVAQLGSRYRLLCYDQRGHGLSDTPPGDYTIEDQVGDLIGLLDHLQIDRLALCGISIGGLIAQGFALAAPRRLAGLVLCDTAARIGDPELWQTRIDIVRAQGMNSVVDAVMERWFSAGFRRGQPESFAGWRNLFVRTDPHGYAGGCATLRDTDLRARIGNITLSTLVIAGEDDIATPVELVRDCAKALPRARFEVLPGAGHIPAIEQPTVLAGLITGYLEELGYG